MSYTVYKVALGKLFHKKVNYTTEYNKNQHFFHVKYKQSWRSIYRTYIPWDSRKIEMYCYWRGKEAVLGFTYWVKHPVCGKGSKWVIHILHFGQKLRFLLLLRCTYRIKIWVLPDNSLTPMFIFYIVISCGKCVGKE